MELLSAPILTVLVSLLVGGLAIFVAARIVTGEYGYGHAVVTALVGAIVWGLATFLLGWLPLAGPVLPLLAWIWVIKGRYDTGWIEAGIIGFVAWVAAVLVLTALSLRGVPVIGVPFV